MIQLATSEIARFLASTLPGLTPDWWQRHVLDRLSFQQQRTAQERRITTLRQFDLAALLRVLDQNWFELSGQLNQGREAARVKVVVASVMQPTAEYRCSSGSP